MPSVPKLIPAPARWRGRAVSVLFALAGLVLAGRLIQLQAVCRSEFAERAHRQSTLREAIPPRPGDLLDRHGRVFATTVAVPSLYVVPSRIADVEACVRQLAAALDQPAEALRERIQSHADAHFLWIKRRLSAEEAEHVRKLELAPGLWGLREEYLRRYPQGALAAQVLGQRNIDGEGQGGLEESLDERLRGTPGWRELIRDARGRVIDVREDAATPPRPGTSIILTLDAVIQLHAERALDEIVETWKPRACCATVLSPATGEVLAMASRPTFDPNHPELADPSAWKNRTIADIYEPGSTFKPCVVAWGLQLGCLKRDEVFNCENGEYRMGSRILHDHHPYGSLDVVGILVKSSNVGMAKIDQRLTNAGLFDAGQAFGFGKPTGIELPGELPGMLRPLSTWTSYSTGSIPMGQEIAATPLQVISAYSALANHGRWIAPHLVLRGADETTAPPRVVSETVSPEVADWIVQHALTEVVQRGTGKKAQLSGYKVFGKTGTAQKLDPKTGGYSRELHVNSFVCGAPSENPEVLVMVTVDEPTLGPDQQHMGGIVAAPYAGKILKKALVQLRIPPRDTSLRSALAPKADEPQRR
ncbi:MAG TPA: penicillin-binding protein 2 [Planctomycetaceae bacterium]|nr:penicillin-binding protein 2 [Planctomycetaceae bacterium]